MAQSSAFSTAGRFNTSSATSPWLSRYTASVSFSGALPNASMQRVYRIGAPVILVRKDNPPRLVPSETSLSPTLAPGLETVAYQSLLDVSQAILQHLDLGGLFRELSSRLKSILHFDYLNLILHDASRNLMRLHILTSATGSSRE